MFEERLCAEILLLGVSEVRRSFLHLGSAAHVLKVLAVFGEAQSRPRLLQTRSLLIERQLQFSRDYFYDRLAGRNVIADVDQDLFNPAFDL